MSEPYLRTVVVSFNKEGILLGGHMVQRTTDAFGREYDGPMEPIAGALQPGTPFSAEIAGKIETQLVASLQYYKAAYEASQDEVLRLTEILESKEE